jgi:quercetin dioxygenase-like cupin family protein
MLCRRLPSRIVALLAAGGLVACSEDAPVAPRTTHHMTPDVSAVALEPFTFRAPLDPYKIQQLPDFMIHSNARKDIVFQRLVFAPGAGPWHTHPGPSFVYVIEGEIKLDRFTKKDGCTETPVSGPGDGYFEVADQVHRAVVVSSQSAVLLVTRFNIPVGQPFTIMAADPGC